MEKIFNCKFVIKLQELGQKLGSNTYLSALQAAMMSVMGVLMVGAISMIINAAAGALGLWDWSNPIYWIINLPFEFTMNLIALWVVVFFAYNYAKKLKLKSPVLNAVDALICFLILAVPSMGKLAVTGADGVITAGGSALPTEYFGAAGMFIGFVVVFLSVRIEKFCVDKNIRIKMPDVVPSFLADSFSSIIPLVISVVFFTAVSAGTVAMTGGAYNVCSGFMALLAKPLGALTSLPGMFVLGILCMVFWTFGIHGSMVLSPIVMPAIMMASSNNAAAFQAGGVEALVFYPVALWACIGMVGGAGNTWALTIMGCFSKSKQIKAVSKISVIPGWFGINEPVAFGMPIMYNPILCIPYILTVPVVMACALIGYKTGFLLPSYIPVFSLLPLGFAGYMTTLNIGNFIFQYLMVIPTAIIWYPFFKVYEKQLVAQEELQEKQQAEAQA